jgi:hypothetical protein
VEGEADEAGDLLEEEVSALIAGFRDLCASSFSVFVGLFQ